MLTIERREEILVILSKKKSITVEELANELFVSSATIRRDLNEMEHQRLIKRSHGGAMLFNSTSEESAFALREQENIVAKKTMANLAIKFIKNGDSIFIDSSSTTGFVAQLLNGFEYLSVTTIGLRNAMFLSNTDRVKTYIAGGQVQNHSNSIIGSDTMDFIERIHANKAIVSCSGIDIVNGFTDSSIEQSKLKQKMRANSDIVIMLADSTKFGRTFLCYDFNFNDIDYLITDKQPSEEFVKAIDNSKCKLITPFTEIYEKI